MIETEEILMTTQEAMDYMEVSRNTFYKWLRAGLLVPSNFNPRLDRQPNPVYRKSDLDAFTEARKAERLRREAQGAPGGE